MSTVSEHSDDVRISGLGDLPVVCRYWPIHELK